jgi:hypothetical protein
MAEVSDEGSSTPGEEMQEEEERREPLNHEKEGSGELTQDSNRKIFEAVQRFIIKSERLKQ